MSNRIQLHAQPSTARSVPGGTQAALDACVERVRQQGLAQGAAQAAANTMESAAAALNGAAEAMDLARQELLPTVAEDVGWLAIEIARQLLRTEIEAGRYDLEAIVRETLEASGAGRCVCTVHLHPDDVASLEGVPFRAGTTLEADVDVERGDVHVTTPRGLMVREMDSALEGIREALRSQTA